MDDVKLVHTGKYRVEYQDDIMGREMTVQVDQEQLDMFLQNLVVKAHAGDFEFFTLKVGAVMEYPEEK